MQFWKLNRHKKKKKIDLFKINKIYDKIQN